MAVVIAAKGTSRQSFQIGKQGPLIKNNSGVLEFRNQDDSNFVEIRAGGGSNPSTSTSLATKEYVDSVAQGLQTKDAVRVATQDSPDMSDYSYQSANDDNTTATPLIWTRTGQGAVFDGVTLVDGDRVLIKDSSDSRGHGICTYVADTGSGNSGFRRTTDADNTPGNEVAGGMFVFVEEGAGQADSGWTLSSPSGDAVLGTDSLNFSQFSGQGSATNAGDGLTKTGDTINVVGTSGRIVANADSIDLASTIENFQSTGITDNATSTSITINTSGNVGIKDASPAFTLNVGGTDGVLISKGTTAQQPGSPETGLLRYNTTNGKLELYDGSFSNVATETWANNNLQALDSDLTALANTSSTGVYVRTGTGTSSTRSIAGTANQIQVSNGDGVSGNPTVSLASNPALPGVQGTELPKGTTAQRPSSPNSGVTRWNTADDKIESFDGSVWYQVAWEGQSNTFDSTIVEDSLTIRRNTAAPQLILENSSATGSGSLEYLDSDALIFRTNSAEKLRLTTDGDLGLGTNNPQADFEIEDLTTTAEPTIQVSGFTGTGGNPVGALNFRNQTAAPSDESAIKLAVGTSDDRRDYFLAIESQGNEWARFEDGDLRIGQSSAVSYTSLGDLVISRAGPSGIVLEAGSTDVSRLAFGDGGDNTLISWVEYDHSTDIMSLRAGDNVTAYVTSNGLGIQGVPSASFNLDVNGNMRSRGSNAGVFVLNDTASAFETLLILQSQQTTPANGDDISIDFTLDNSNNNAVDFARIQGGIQDVTAGAEDGELFLLVSSGGSLTTKAQFNDSQTFMQGVNDNTTASAANVFINSSTGLMQRSTSSRKYKENIADYDKGLNDLQKLQPKSFNSNSEGDDHLYAGLIAEDVDAAGLSEYVVYDENGQPDGLHYAHMVALLINANKELANRVEELEKQLKNK